MSKKQQYLKSKRPQRVRIEEKNIPQNSSSTSKNKRGFVPPPPPPKKKQK